MKGDDLSPLPFPPDFQELLFDLVRQAIVGALEVDEVVSVLNELCNTLVRCLPTNTAILTAQTPPQDIKSVFPSLLADMLAIAGENYRLSCPQVAKMSMGLNQLTPKIPMSPCPKTRTTMPLSNPSPWLVW